jgi:Protein of unknown function (DUF2752)
MSDSRPVPTCAAETRTPLAATTRAQILLGACACAGVSLFVYAVDPSRHAVYPQCILYNTTGLYCAGCGATRAVFALLHGRVLDALHDNALFVAALPWLLYLAGWYLVRAWRDNAWPEVFVDTRKVAWRGAGIFLVMITFMIVRNLPGAPFDWLRPLG